MDNDVTNPGHYRRGDIEVIDVIEQYAREDFRLANVLKYVCRCDYKGHKLDDLKKAAWYLNRVIDELQLEFEESDTYFDETIEEAIAKKDEMYRTFPSTRYEVELPKERIAGSTDAAQDIKNEYYTHDPFLIAGYCTSCDKELQLHSPYFKALTVDAPATGYLFCSHSCLDAWKAHGR